MAVQGSLQSRSRSDVREPKQYSVVMLNDDFTPMDFVVEILKAIFHKDEVTAETLMMKVHREGRAVVGVYSYDIAVSKAQRAMQQAKLEGYPFKLTVEEA